MLPQSTIQRIKNDAEAYSTAYFHQETYKDAATVEAEKAAGLVEALKKTEAKINALIEEDSKGRAIEVAIIMANAMKEISQITSEALTKYNNQ